MNLKYPRLVAAVIAAVLSSIGVAKNGIPIPIPTGDRELLVYSIRTGLVNAIFAKEFCSCHFIAGLSQSECLRRANLPQGANLLAVVEISEDEKLVQATTSLAGRLLALSNGPVAVASYDSQHPQFGCRLVLGPFVDKR